VSDGAVTTEPRPFAPRPIVPHDPLHVDGWRIKRYAITVDGAPLDWDAFAPGVAHALHALPRPAAAPGRPGVGFVVAHRGRGADYVVLGWWSAENELPVQVVVRPQTHGAAWHAARAGESFCVWDLQVIGFERDAWIDTVLSPDPSRAPLAERIDAYLARRLALP
jgi:anti-sigma factor RsiW